MAGHVPGTIVLALGIGVLGGVDALRLLLDTAWRSPLHDIFTCVLAMSVVTAHALGILLLARFFRKARAGGGGAAGAPATTDNFARMTATVSAGAAFLAAACLLVGSGGLGALRLALDSAKNKIKNPAAAAAVVIGIVATVGGFFPYTVRPLLRFVRGAGSAAGAGAGAAPAPAPTNTDRRRFPKLTQGTFLALAAVAFALASLIIAIPFAYAQPGRESGVGKAGSA